MKVFSRVLTWSACACACAFASAGVLRGESPTEVLLEMGAGTSLGAALENRLEDAKATVQTSMTCQWYFSCAQCATVANCGWCNDCGRCVEGGRTGPAETNCMSWDYQQCSGKDGFDDEVARSSKDELQERARLVAQWKVEKAAYVAAKDNVARVTAIITKGKQSTTVGSSVAAATKHNLLPAETALKAAGDDCATFTKLKAVHMDALKSAEKLLQDNEAALGTLAKDIGGATNEDEKDRLQKLLESKTADGEKYKTARDATRAKVDSSADGAKKKCGGADLAAGRLAKAKNVAASAEAEAQSRAQLASMQSTLLAAAKAEMARSVASATGLSAQIKQLTKKLANIRSAKQAHGVVCKAGDEEK